MHNPPHRLFFTASVCGAEGEEKSGMLRQFIEVIRLHDKVFCVKSAKTTWKGREKSTTEGKNLDN